MDARSVGVGGSVSLYQDVGDNNWSYDAMARYNYDSFSDDSRSQSNPANIESVRSSGTGSQMGVTLHEEAPSNETTGLLKTSTHPYHDKQTLPDTRFGEGFMDKYSNYNQKLSNVHVWVIVFCKSLDHIGRKFFEYFAYYLAFDYFSINSFYNFAWCVAAVDIAAILAMFVFPFLVDKSPKKLQTILQSLIGKSIIVMSFWKGMTALFILRFIFGLAYSLLLSTWSSCVAAFIPHAKQARAVSKIELSWAIASFSFILVAWILDHSGINVILYALGISGVLSACVLGGIMPSSKLVFVEYDRERVCEMTRSMFGDILFGDVACATFLGAIGLISFTNMMLTICLAPWFIQDYELTLTEFGYTTVMLGTAQLTSIIFSGQFRNRLGTGWSMVAGTLVQLIMFVLLLLFNDNGIIVTQLGRTSNDGVYTFPLLIILLFLCIHFIAAEFTYINASTAMMQIQSKTSQTVAGNCLRLVTSSARIVGAVVGVIIWESGAFKLVVLVGTVCLGCALILGMVLMGYILKEQAFTEIHLRELNDDRYDEVSSQGSEDMIKNRNRNRNRKGFDTDMAEMKRRQNQRNALLSSESEMDSNESDYGDVDETDSDGQHSFVNEKLNVEAILNDIDNFQHNVDHVNNLQVL